MHYLLVILSNIFLAFDFAIAKRYQADEGTQLVPSLRFNLFNGLFTAILGLLLLGFQPGFSLYSLIMAFLMALCCMSYCVLGFQILRSGNIASYTLFLMSGGMLLPYLFGVLFLNEQLTVFRILGVIAILVAVILSGSGQMKLNGKVLLLCIAVFFLNGGVSIISKCHQVTIAFPTVDSTAFVMYSGIGKCVLSAAVLLMVRHNSGKFTFTKKSSLPFIACSALVGGLSYLLQLIGAKELPATVLYPIVTGGSIIFSAFSGKIFFKETITRRQWISIGLCLIGTLFFL